jgi:hypothetical protein
MCVSGLNRAGEYLEGSAPRYSKNQENSHSYLYKYPSLCPTTRWRNGSSIASTMEYSPAYVSLTYRRACASRGAGMPIKFMNAIVSRS